MNLIGCLDTATTGSYRLRKQEVSGLNREQLAEIRNRRVGFIFQSFNLLPQITAYENVEMPLLFGGDIMNLFHELWEHGHTVLVITHDPALAHRAPRRVEIRDGLITYDSRQ